MPIGVNMPIASLSVGLAGALAPNANALTFNWIWTATHGRDNRDNRDNDTSPNLSGTVVQGTINNLLDSSLNTDGMTATCTSGFNIGQTVSFDGGAGVQVTNGSVVTPGLQAYFHNDNYGYSMQLEVPNGNIGIFGGEYRAFQKGGVRHFCYD